MLRTAKLYIFIRIWPFFEGLTSSDVLIFIVKVNLSVLYQAVYLSRGLPMWFCLKSGFRAKIGISRKNRDFRRPWAKYWDFKCTRWAAPSVCTLKSLFFAMGAPWALEIHGFCKEVHMRAPMAKFWDFKVHTECTHEGRLNAAISPVDLNAFCWLLIDCDALTLFLQK